MADEMEQEPIGFGGPWSADWSWGGPMMGRRWGWGMRRGPMRPWGPPMFWGGPWGPRGPRGWFPDMGRRFPFGGGPGPRMFERGHLKYALLQLLQEGPKHGYEMMKNLEDRMGGFYAPSAGAIYPTLQLLEDRGWATSETVEGKKVYTITEEGRKALSEQAERQGPRPGGFPFGPEGGPGFGPGFGRGFGPGFGRGFGPESEPGFGPHGSHGHGPHHEHHEHHGRPEGPWGWEGEWGGRGFDRQTQQEVRELARQARELGRAFLFAGRSSINQPERIAQLRQIVERTRAELEAFIREQQSAQSQGESASAASEPGPDGPVEQL